MFRKLFVVFGVLLVFSFARCAPEIAPPEEAATAVPTRAVATPSLSAAEGVTLEVMTPEPTTTPPAQEDEPMPTQPAAGSIQDQWIAKAKADLAARLNVSVDQVDVKVFENVVWPDGSLGCPRPGMMYTQVLQEGYRIVLAYGEETFPYHGTGQRDPFLCENPSGSVTTPLPGYSDK